MADYQVTNIRYDTDGQRVSGLPKSMIIRDVEDPDDLADRVSDETEWCVDSLSYTVIS